MSYDAHDSAMDDMYERISDELYPEHKSQAIGEFTADRLRSFYVDNPCVMRPAVDALLEAQRLQDNGHAAAAVVFAVSCTELLLKAAILTPVMHGLVHIESLADVVVENTLSGPGYTRYAKLLARLFTEFVGIDIHSLRRPESTATLLWSAMRSAGCVTGLFMRAHPPPRSKLTLASPPRRRFST